MGGSKLNLLAYPLRTVCSRILLYADNAVMFIAPIANNLAAIKTILQIFGDATGLYTNLDKCVATSIACSQEVQLAQNALSALWAPSLAETWASPSPHASFDGARSSS
jgi:hypothetical protein